MNSQDIFCANIDCPARGQIGKGNIGIRSQKEKRYICHVCEPTFTATKGTIFYRLRTEPQTVLLVIALLAYGCPIQAIVWVRLALTNGRCGIGGTGAPYPHLGTQSAYP
jgi:transposase-like protein